MPRAALILLQTLLLLGLTEGAARLAEWLHPAAEDVTFAYAPYRMLRMAKAPWPLNREGFRARELESYRGSFLVEFLGGSVCLGAGTNPGRIVPERLKEALHAAGLTRASVLNLCQGGATSGQELAIFLQYGLPLEPEVVLSFDGANDLLHPRPFGDDDAPNLPYKNALLRAVLDGDDPVARHLALARVAGRLIHRVPAVSADPAVPPPDILHSYEYTLGVTGTLAASRGALYAVLFQPTLHFAKPWSPQEAGMWRGRRPQDGEAMSRGVRDLYAGAAAELARWAAARNLMLVDLTRTFERTPETIYSDSVHFTGERGYAMVFEEIERHELLARIAARYRAWERRAPLGPRPAIGDNGWR